MQLQKCCPESCCCNGHHGDTSTLYVWRTYKWGNLRATAPLLELQSFISARNGSNSKKMFKKHSFNHQLNSVVTKHSHALLAGHPSSAATVLSWSFLPGHSELLRGNAKTQPGLEGVDVSANSGSKANLNIQIAPALFPSLCKSQHTTTQIYRKSTFAKKKALPDW